MKYCLVSFLLILFAASGCSQDNGSVFQYSDGDIESEFAIEGEKEQESEPVLENEEQESEPTLEYEEESLVDGDEDIIELEDTENEEEAPEIESENPSEMESNEIETEGIDYEEEIFEVESDDPFELESNEIEAETTDYSEKETDEIEVIALEPDHTLPDSVDSEFVVETSGFQFVGILKEMRWIASSGETLQNHTGEINIDTRGNAIAFATPDSPKHFSHVRVYLDHFQMGGGDGRGIIVDPHAWQGMGGGDGRGIVIPELFIKSIGDTAWSNVELRFEITSYATPNSAEERLALARQFVNGLTVWQNGMQVGQGDADATMNRCAIFPSTGTGQASCYSSEGETIPCEFTGQDGETASLSEFVEEDGKQKDLATGLVWDSSPTENLSFNESKTSCESRSMRIPTLFEIRTIMDFGQNDRALAPPFSASQKNLWTATSVSEEKVDGDSEGSDGDLEEKSPKNYVLDSKTGNVAESPITSTKAAICVKGVGLVLNAEKKIPFIDTVSGRMWNETGSAGSWNEALEICKNSMQEGFSDWRLPNIAELTLLQGRLSPGETSYWSSTSYMPLTKNAWIYDGITWQDKVKTESHFVLCIRNIPQFSGL